MGDSGSQDPNGDLEDVDPGQPLSLLADLGEAPRPNFFGRVWDSIERRQLGGDFVELIWHIPFVVLRELLHVVTQLLGPAGKGEEGRE